MKWKFSHLWLHYSFTFPGQCPCAWGSELKRPRSDLYPVESAFGKLSTLPFSTFLTSRVFPASESRALLILPGKESAFEFHFLIGLPSLQRTLPLGPYFPTVSIILFFYFFSFIFISWRLITLQYCSGFCHTLTWISHGLSIILIHLFSCLSLWSLFSWQLLLWVYSSKCVYRANELMSARTGALLFFFFIDFY